MKSFSKKAMRITWSTSLLFFLAVVSYSPMMEAHDPITTKVTFNKEVVRILERRCQGCHHDGGYAPMALETYDQVRPWAKAIKEEILERRMPPWNAAQGFADFSNDRSLTPLETELLVDWVEGGAPVGDAKDLPKPKSADDAAEKPGLVVTGEASAPSKESHWISAWRFTPAGGAIQSAEFWIEDAARKRTYLGNWSPPEGLIEWPDGVAQQLPAGSRVTVALHYVDTSAENSPAPHPPASKNRLELFFSAKAPAHPVRHLDLSCGANAIPSGMEALAVYPENSMEMEALLPNGSMDVLGLFRPDFPSYHPTYFYRRPIAIPSGARIATHAVAAQGGCKAILAYSARPTR